MPNSKTDPKSTMLPVRLRGHHFLCMLTYKGLGYSAEFTANMSAIIALINEGRPILLVKGADDICAGMSKACSAATGHDCGLADILAMDVLAQTSVENVLERKLSIECSISKSEIGLLRHAFANGALRQACAGCSWFEVCNAIAATGFQSTHLTSAELKSIDRAGSHQTDAER